MIVEVSVGDTDPGEYFMKGPTDLVSLWSYTGHPFSSHQLTGHQLSGLKDPIQLNLVYLQSMISSCLHTCATKQKI